VGQVIDLSLCTFSDERRFFSYRRATHRNEKDYGRLISAIALT
jgi:copper oxidase (laccase) domain-containing protein